MSDINKDLLDEFTKGNDKIAKELKELKEQADAAKIANDLVVKGLNETIAAKDGTLKDIQDAVLELKAKGGRMIGGRDVKSINMSDPRNIQGVIFDTIGAKAEEFKNGANFTKGTPLKLDTKASTITSSSLTGNPFFDYLPVALGQRPFGQVRFRDFAPVLQSDFYSVIYPVQGTAPNSGSFNYQQTEGAGKAQLDYTWNDVTLNLKMFAGYAKVSRQSLTNIPFLQSYLPMNLMEDLLDQEDKNFAATLVAGATGSTTVTGSNGSDIEDIIFLMTNLLKTKYQPTAVAIDPAKWASILCTKPGSTVTNYSLPFVVTIDANGGTRILGKPLSPVNWLSGGNVIVGDWAKVGIVETGGLQMRQTDSDGTDFVANVLTFLLERAEGVAIFRPDAFCTKALA